MYSECVDAVEAGKISPSHIQMVSTMAKLFFCMSAESSDANAC